MRILHFIPNIDRTSSGVGAYMQLFAEKLGSMYEFLQIEDTGNNLEKVFRRRLLEC